MPKLSLRRVLSCDKDKETLPKTPAKRETIGRLARVQTDGAAPALENVTIVVNRLVDPDVAALGYDEVIWAPGQGPTEYKNVPYDEWRKHYAKDAQGRYRGTHAPADDCLLMPEDKAKHRRKSQVEADEAREAARIKQGSAKDAPKMDSINETAYNDSDAWSN